VPNPAVLLSPPYKTFFNDGKGAFSRLNHQEKMVLLMALYTAIWGIKIVI
jgi:hypothetical protein